MKQFWYKIIKVKISSSGFLIFLFFIIFAVVVYRYPGFFAKTGQKTEIAQIIEKWQEKELYLPLCDSIANKPITQDTIHLKIISFIDGNCGVCIGELDKWKPIIKKLQSSGDIVFLFYVHAMDFDGLIKHISKEVPFPIPLINDHENLFFTKNKLEQTKMFQTFLVDHNNKIIFVGNPVLSDKVRDLYTKTILELKNDR